jgi:hypothetical protein
VDGETTIGGHREPGLDLFQVHPPVLGVSVPDHRERVVLVLPGVGAMDGHAGHVPVQPTHIDAELRDRPRPDRARELFQVRGNRVQRAGEAVVIEQVRLDAEDLLHRPGPRPVPDPHQRRGRGEPVRYQRLDHLAVGQVGARAARAQPVDDPGHVQPAQKLGSDRQSTQTLLHHGHHRALKALTLGPRPRGTGSHRHTQLTPPAPPQTPHRHPIHTNQRPAKYGASRAPGACQVNADWGHSVGG